MFSGFNLEITEQFFGQDFEKYKKEAKANLNSRKESIQKAVDTYIEANIINGTKLQEDWFPQIESDIFISHSHKDEELALALAGWIKDKFNLDCFIDSCVWEYADNLMEALNAKYSDKRSDPTGGYLYSHSGCIQVSKHVDTMLTLALQRMIDKIESVFLIKTQNSINAGDIVDAKTYSPWIYMEILSSKIIRKKPLLVYREYTGISKSVTESHQFSELNNELPIKYSVSLKHLIELDSNALEAWKKEFENGDYEYSLDALYKNYYQKEISETQNACKNIPDEELNALKEYYETGSRSTLERLDKAAEVILG